MSYNDRDSHRIISKKKILCTSKKKIDKLINYLSEEHGLSYDDSRFTLIEILKDIECD